MKYVDKSDDFESFLVELNRAACSISEPALATAPPRSAQIVGIPRSGTTLLYQLLAHTGDVGYPSNVMAYFHQAPWVGARLQVQLAATGPKLTYESVGGRTREPLDPHELGYFWRRVCGHEGNSLVPDRQPLPSGDLQRELDLVASVFGRPVVYKNFLAIVHSSWMRDLPRMSFVVVRRDLREVAASLLQLRVTLATAHDAPLGVQPTRQLARGSDVVHTVARQVVTLADDLNAAGLEPAADVLVVENSELCRDPRGVVARVLEMMGAETTGVSAVPRRLRADTAFSRLDVHGAARIERALSEAQEELDRD